LRTALAVNQIFVTDADGNVVKNKYNGVKYSNEYAGKFHSIKRDGRKPNEEGGSLLQRASGIRHG
jgi:hypothetical protein